MDAQRRGGTYDGRDPGRAQQRPGLPPPGRDDVEFLVREVVPAVLDGAGLDDHARRLRAAAVPSSFPGPADDVLRGAYAELWDRRGRRDLGPDVVVRSTLRVLDAYRGGTVVMGGTVRSVAVAAEGLVGGRLGLAVALVARGVGVAAARRTVAAATGAAAD